MIRALPSFWLNLLNARDRKALFTCIVDHNWSDSRVHGWTWFCYVWMELDGIGQASMEGCEILKTNNPSTKYQVPSTREQLSGLD